MVKFSSLESGIAIIKVTVSMDSISIKNLLDNSRRFHFVQAERLELSHLAALDPKSSVSTNSTTPAKWIANINIPFNIQIYP